MVIGGHRRLDFDVREHPKLRVLWQRGSIPSADVAPEVEEKTRAALEGTAKVTVLAQIDSRVENSREDPAVLEKVVSRRRFFRGIGQGALRGQPGNEAFRAEDRGGGKSRECGNAGDSPRAQQFDGAARFRTQTGEFLFRQQSVRANPGQHRQCTRALWVIEDSRHIEVALVSALGAVVRHTFDLGKYAFTVAFERERVHAPQHLPVGFRNGAWHDADSFIVEAERE